MRSRFEGELQLSREGRTVTVEEPIDWLGEGAGATRMSRVAATTTQTSGGILADSPLAPIAAGVTRLASERLAEFREARCEHGCWDRPSAAGRRER
jgi:hypothetical protein